MAEEEEGRQRRFGICQDSRLALLIMLDIE